MERGTKGGKERGRRDLRDRSESREIEKEDDAVTVFEPIKVVVADGIERRTFNDLQLDTTRLNALFHSHNDRRMFWPRFKRHSLSKLSFLSFSLISPSKIQKKKSNRLIG